MESSEKSVTGFRKKAVVVHSGGMDSSICLALALQEFGPKDVLSLSFSYGQRHSLELERAAQICSDWGVDHTVLDISCLGEITVNSLTRHDLPFENQSQGNPPNSLVVGRNGLMARIAAIHAHHLGAQVIFMGIMELEAANSGYRDCSRLYMNKMEEILRMDLADSTFEIRTPLVSLTKPESLKVAHGLGVLSYLLETTITCYAGKSGTGCESCPACLLRNAGILEFLKEFPEVQFSYRKNLEV